MEGLQCSSATSGGGQALLSRVRTGWKEPGWMTDCYYNMQEPLYVGCPNPSATSMAPPAEEERDSSEPEEGTTGATPAQADHTLGDCSPCAYFWQKADGCRLGDECQYCHLCDRDAIRRWKKAKKQRKKADALRNAATSRNSQKKSAGVGSASKKLVGVVNTSNVIPAVVAEPARVNLPMQSSPKGMSSRIGMSRPYLPLDVLAGPPGLGIDLTVSSGKLGFGDLFSDDDGACLSKASRLLGQDDPKLGNDDGIGDSQTAASEVASFIGSSTSTSFNTIKMDRLYTSSGFQMSAIDEQERTSSFSNPVNVFPYLQQRRFS